MDRSPSRRDVLRAGASSAVAALAGCSFYNPKADIDTPDPNPTATTPSPRPMQPFNGAQGPMWNDVDSIEQAVFERVNKARSARNLEAYAWDPDLAYMAKAHCRDMGERGYFAHESPDGESPSDRMMAYGLDSTYASVTENLVRFSIPEKMAKDAAAERIFRVWKESEDHWEAILKTINDRAGTGVYITEDRTLYGAMVFGKLVDPHDRG